MRSRTAIIVFVVTTLLSCSGKKSGEDDTYVDTEQDTAVTDTTEDSLQDTAVMDTVEDVAPDTVEDASPDGVMDTMEDTASDVVMDTVEDTVADPVDDEVVVEDVAGEDVIEEDVEMVCDTSSPDAGCFSTGGTESLQLCCESTSDWPNLCATGPCGCAPAYSHEVKVCVCPSSMCFDGSCCVPL